MDNYINLTSFQSVYNSQNSNLLESFKKIANNSLKNDISDTEITDLYHLLNFNNFYNNLNAHQKDGYFLNYVIEGGLREEFDILRFSEKKVLNIELKSELPKNGMDDIRHQLIRHKFILSILNKETTLCCSYIRKSNQFLFLDGNNQLQNLDIMVLIKEIEDNFSPIIELKNIDSTDLIISPYTEPFKFVDHKYFLTDEQLKARNQIISSKKHLHVLKGGPGTGKTMVLLDLAKKANKRNDKVLVVFVGKMPDASQISSTLGITILPIAEAIRKELESYDLILLDESQRIWEDQFNIFYNLVHPTVIFSVDQKQTLHPAEKGNNYEKRLIEDPNVENIVLKGKIRTDPSLSSFIKKLLNLKEKNVEPHYYNKVKAIYFSDYSEAKQYISHMKNTEDYVPIELTEYVTKSFGNLKRRKIFSGSKDTHSVIGREYDNVLVVFDEHICHKEVDNQYILSSNYNEYYPYDEHSAIFEALTRVKKQLLLVVVDNVKLFTTIQEILTWKTDIQNISFPDDIKQEIKKLEESFSSYENKVSKYCSSKSPENLKQLTLQKEKTNSRLETLHNKVLNL